MEKVLFRICLTIAFGLFVQACKVNNIRNKQLNPSVVNGFDNKRSSISPILVAGQQNKFPGSAGEITSTGNANHLTIETEQFICTIGKEPFEFYFINKASRDSFRITSVWCYGTNESEKSLKSGIKTLSGIVREGNTWSFKDNNSAFELKVEVIQKSILKMSVESPVHAGYLQIGAEGHGPYYGGGERFLSSRLDGRSFKNHPNDRLFMRKFDDEELRKYEPTYLSVPFVLNPGGFGLYADNAESCEFEIGQNGNSLKMTAEKGVTDLYLFAGKTPKEVLKSYTGVVGRQPMIPRWGLGIWTNLLEGRDSVIAKAQRLKKYNIPVDAVWIFDLDDPTTSTGWTHWSRGYYGNPRELTDTLHKLDLKVLTYLHPYENKKLLYYKFNNPVYDYCVKNNLLLKTDSSIDNRRFASMNPHELVDFYNPETEAWWKGCLKEILSTDNFDGWMEDFGDISYKYDFETNIWSAVNYITNYPFSNEVLANLYPLVYHKTTFTIAKSIKPDMIGFCRSGSAGSAPYTSLVWGGDQTADWDKRTGYPCLITAGISAGLSGYGIWAPDILCNSSSVELWKRWVQLGAFSPTMRDHLWSNDPRSIDLWTNESTIQYFKKYAWIHSALEPYLFSLAKEASENGIPIIRHMMLEYPENPEVYDCEYQYLLGSEILVAPVVEENAIKKKVYLPEGEWIHIWSKKVFPGGNWIEADAPVDQIPVFIRNKSSNQLVDNLLKNFSELKP